MRNADTNNWNTKKGKTAICRDQIARFDGMEGYPRSESAIEDLIEALEAAATEEQAIGVIYSLKETADERTRCPTAATIRRAVYDAQESQRKALQKCSACDGTGAVIYPMLVTYRGSGFLIGSEEIMRGSTDADIATFTKQIMEAKEAGTIGPEQMILSAAEPCACRKFGRPIVRESSACERCKGHGFYGGHIGGKFAGEWKWCDCEAARNRQALEPGIMDEANYWRDKLMLIGAKKIGTALNSRARRANLDSVSQIIGVIDGGRQ